MAIYVVGDFVRETRIRKGYSQEEVSFGICSVASLSRIENGEQTPSRLTLEKLLERMGTENNLFNVFVSREELELYETVQTITRNITDGNLDELESQVCKLENMIRQGARLERQYLLFAKGELLRQRDGADDEVMELLMQSIHLTLPKFDGFTPLTSNLLTFDEIMIINAIAIQHAKMNRVKTALGLGFWLKNYMKDKVVEGKLKTAKYPMILYNLSNWLAIIERYLDAFEMADEAVEFCIKYGNLVMLPFVVFNKACALAEFGKCNEVKRYFVQSIAVFETTKQFERARTATDWCVNHYKIEL